MNFCILDGGFAQDPTRSDDSTFYQSRFIKTREHSQILLDVMKNLGVLLGYIQQVLKDVLREDNVILVIH